jgi:hypothetical protein
MTLPVGRIPTRIDALLSAIGNGAALGAEIWSFDDFDIAAAGGDEVSLTRDQTIMQGAPSCTFRYKFAPR